MCSTSNISLDACFNMMVNVGMLGLCLRVVLPGVPLEDVQDIAPWGSRSNDFGCCESLIHHQYGVVEHHWIDWCS